MSLEESHITSPSSRCQKAARLMGNGMFQEPESLSDIVMGKEYRIIFAVPADYNPANLFKKMPSPIHRQTMSEIYNYKIEKDGFYFSDSLVDNNVASVAFRLFVDEALKHSKSIEIIEL